MNVIVWDGRSPFPTAPADIVAQWDGVGPYPAVSRVSAKVGDPTETWRVGLPDGPSKEVLVFALTESVRRGLTADQTVVREQAVRHHNIRAARALARGMGECPECGREPAIAEGRYRVLVLTPHVEDCPTQTDAHRAHAFRPRVLRDARTWRLVT